MGTPADVRKVHMKTLLTRGLVGVSALAVPLAASLALPAAAAHAGTPGSTTAASILQSGAGTGPNPYNGTVSSNLDVPAGVRLVLNGAEVTGNVTVEGTLFAANTQFDKNVTVTGGHIQFNNQPTLPSNVKGNLTVTGSDNSDMNGFWVNTHIVGNFTYYGNAAPPFMGATVTVDGQTNIS
jgi:hypothetical protein